MNEEIGPKIFNVDEFYNKLDTAITDFSDRLGDRLTPEIAETQQEALDVVDSLKRARKVNTKEGLIDDLNFRRAQGTLSEDAYEMITRELE
jgi:hypothetical protein